jgi:acyl-[acyl-carrier-protein]-phospholipid O-acyltransferase / long-chain-fatty-acid--[acyl-carrier-protein] ligase
MFINQFSLLQKRQFLPLFITQLLTILNDQIFKSSLVMFITYNLINETKHAQVLINLAGAIYGLPFLLFSAVIGQFVDKYDRVRLARIIKLVELILVLLGFVAFYLSYLPCLFVILFLLGMHSTLMGPIKYSSLPYLLSKEELLAGNALTAGSSVLVVFVGVMIGAELAWSWSGALVASGLTILFAGIGWLSSFYIPIIAPAEPGLKINYNLVTETIGLIRKTFKDNALSSVILKISWFVFASLAVATQFPIYAKAVVGGDQHVVALFFALFAVGVAFGGLLCNRLLKGIIKETFAPWALLGMMGFTLDFAYVSHVIAAAGTLMPAGSGIERLLSTFYGVRICVDIFMLALFSGLYAIPLYALLQVNSPIVSRGRTIACNAVINSIFGVLASVFVILLVLLGLKIPGIFGVIGLLHGLIIFTFFSKLRLRSS